MPRCTSKRTEEFGSELCFSCQLSLASKEGDPCGKFIVSEYKIPTTVTFEGHVVVSLRHCSNGACSGNKRPMIGDIMLLLCRRIRPQLLIQLDYANDLAGGGAQRLALD